MKWDSFEDFQKKYDDRVNLENFVLRVSFWNLCDSIGYQSRTGLIDIGTVCARGAHHMGYKKKRC